MRHLVIALLAVLFSAPPTFADEPTPLRRIETILCDLKSGALIVTVSEGNADPGSGEFTVKRTVEYRLDLRAAIMDKSNQRPVTFSKEEASVVEMLSVDGLIKYVGSSIVWYEKGGGRPVEPPSDNRQRFQARK